VATVVVLELFMPRTTCACVSVFDAGNQNIALVNGVVVVQEENGVHSLQSVRDSTGVQTLFGFPCVCFIFAFDGLALCVHGFVVVATAYLLSPFFINFKNKQIVKRVSI
jgi:hypothetical protein